MNAIWNGDCLEDMDWIADGSVDIICVDLPYGVTKNVWDIKVSLSDIWRHFNRIKKPTTPVLLFGQNAFTAELIASNLKAFRYTLVYRKSTPSGHYNASRQPLRVHEDIVVFYDKPPVYNPQKSFGHARKVSSALHKRNSKKSDNYGDAEPTNYDSTERFPVSVLDFKTDKQKSKLNATQKPVGLIEYLIKTFSNENDLALDCCSGSGTLAVACINTNRKFLCIEKDVVQFKQSVKRIAELT